VRKASFPGQSAWGLLDVLYMCWDQSVKHVKTSPPSVPRTEFVTTVATWRCASFSPRNDVGQQIGLRVRASAKKIAFRNDVLSRRQRLILFPTETIWICVGASKVRNICSVRGRKDKTCFTHFDRLTLRRIVSGTFRPWNI
jgi:hypothetical protein